MLLVKLPVSLYMAPTVLVPTPYWTSLSLVPFAADAGAQTIANLDNLRNAEGPKRTAEIRLNMQKTMQSDAAVFRTQETLDED
ncbi:hypothetical protein G6F68_020767 [Rhizopus microsporus]|nr:hypothetical protein G6F68_020767 [Rhizopus microsporus]